MSKDTVNAAALLPQECGMVCRLRYNQQTNIAELFFGIRTPQQEIAFGMDYYETEELVRTLTHLMEQVPPSKRGPKKR
jgi:hypothetical protein